MVVMCGRNQESVQYFFDKLFERPEKITKDLLHLINNLSKANPFETSSGCQPLRYRGFAFIKQKPDSCLEFSKTIIKRVSEKPKEVCFVFTGIGSQWTSMAAEVMKYEVISESIRKSCLVLNNKGIDLMKILEEKDMNETGLHSMVSLVALQIGLTDLLKDIEVVPHHIIGHSSGEIVSSYADGCITREEALLIAYNCGKFIEEVSQLKAFNAKINKLKREDLNKFFDEYYQQIVNSHDMSTKIQTLLNELEFILKTKALKPNKWIVNQTNNNSESVVCGQYFIDNLLFPVLFSHKLQSIPKNSIIVEVSTDCLLNKEFKTFQQNYTFIPLMKTNANNSEFLLKSFGKLYSEGINLKIERLYPTVNEPVSTGTRILSPLIKWDHSKTYRLTKYPDFFNFFNSREDKSYTIDFMVSNDQKKVMNE